ncbi:uncharacterized protein MELLADRAFT_101772 [Melampsora larici-populina 98AG31]|uniref:F-box protein Hrt3/FBXO9 C-terminal domain-containing protein n=1 Tax=Melampsora larici-populina (strain 98AG31 / pathotype 3-4-7) TaxID=747676 RepID=F4R6X2_MELLP|nr:uncharacterized protein MELLADRAFT_101772 [Melampsora larici-populina 98AG31]EGG12380.1 hypothetical protein MELLADRAFT_101772 [Melampsora larici-populina 98AG31]
MNPSQPSSSSLQTPVPIDPSTQQLLESFRHDWLNEVKERTKRLPTTTSCDKNNSITGPVPPIHSSRLCEPEPAPSQHPGPSSPRNHSYLDQRLDPTHSDVDQSSDTLGFANTNGMPDRRAHSPVITYAMAVYYEKIGLLDNALDLYRTAFKADPAVDRQYHCLNTQELEALEQQFDRLDQSEYQSLITFVPAEAGKTQHDGKGKTTAFRDNNTPFKYSRPIHTEDDYQMEGSAQSHTVLPMAHNLPGLPQALSTHQKLPKNRRTRIEHVRLASPPKEQIDNHPSSTRKLRRGLLQSYKDNPWIRPPTLSPEENLETSEENVTAEKNGLSRDVFETSKFIDDASPSNGAVDAGTSGLTLDSRSSLVKQPESDYAEPSTQPDWNHQFEPDDLTLPCPLRSLPHEILLYIFHLYLKPCNSTFIHSHAILIERFAQVSRLSRLLMLEDQLWKPICEETYSRKFLKDDTCITRDPKDAIRNVCHRWHGMDWRRIPRVREDGCFIAPISYPRLGESDNPWYTPTHFVTYYRYLRFFPDGTCLNFTTSDHPARVVRTFDKPLRAKGLTIGKWELVGDLINIWDLEERAMPHTNARIRATVDSSDTLPPSNFQLTYKLQMRCRLKSTQRGKMSADLGTLAFSIV